MSNLNYSIEDDVFAQFPGYTRGVVLAFDVVNSESPPELTAMLREAEKSLRGCVKKEEIAAHPQIMPWREAFRSFGAKPGKFRSSIEAMTRRVLNDNSLPSINALVDIGNLISLRHLLPVGGHAIDVATQNFSLRKATGEEEFMAFGSNKVEHPKPGEIIFAEGNTVLTRRWSWRQANHTLTLPSTTAIAFNIDGMPPVLVSGVEKICHEVSDLIDRFCGGRMRNEILSQENPLIRLAEDK